MLHNFFGKGSERLSNRLIDAQGHHFFASFSQFFVTDAGQMISVVPNKSLSIVSAAKTSIVLPVPGAFAIKTL
jgi:hypothetical protein